MFCPAIRRKCVGKECRDWVPEASDCQVRLDRKLMYQFAEQQRKLVELGKLDVVWSKLTISYLLSDPNVPDEAKEAIKQAMQAPSAEVAEKLLRDAGLIKE